MADYWMDKLNAIVSGGRYSAAQSRHTRTPILIDRQSNRVDKNLPGSQSMTQGVYVQDFAPEVLTGIDATTAAQAESLASLLGRRDAIAVGGEMMESPDYDHTAQKTNDPKVNYPIDSPQTVIRHEDAHSVLGPGISRRPNSAARLMEMLADKHPDINEVANSLGLIGYGNKPASMLNEVTARMISAPDENAKTLPPLINGLRTSGVVGLPAIEKLKRIMQSGRKSAMDMPR